MKMKKNMKHLEAVKEHETPGSSQGETPDLETHSLQIGSFPDLHSIHHARYTAYTTRDTRHTPRAIHSIHHARYTAYTTRDTQCTPLSVAIELLSHRHCAKKPELRAENISPRPRQHWGLAISSLNLPNPTSSETKDLEREIRSRNLVSPVGDEFELRLVISNEKFDREI